MHPQQQLGHLQYAYNRDGVLVATLKAFSLLRLPGYLYCINEGYRCTHNNRLDTGYRGKELPRRCILYDFFDFITMSIL